MRQLLVNERIRINQVLVIDEDDTQLGAMNPMDGVRLARERGLDLVCVSPEARPPVCRIMDFNKFRYQEDRREREGKKKHHISKLKEVKFRPRIEEHDYRVKLGNLKRFLSRGDKAKVTLVYRGREMRHKELGTRVLDRIVEDLKLIGKMERTPLMEGRFLTLVLSPDRDGLRRVAKQAASQQDSTGKKTKARKKKPSKSEA